MKKATLVIRILLGLILVVFGFNNFFRGSVTDVEGNPQPGDFVYFQGHASPGIYSRAFLEGRLSRQHLDNFRHELRDEPGLSEKDVLLVTFVTPVLRIFSLKMKMVMPT